jgi:hypothetical protein
MYLMKINNYSDYETAACASTLDIGNVLGGGLIGYLTDLTYSRRTPLAVLSIILATVMQVFLIMVSPDLKFLFFLYIFIFGLLIGGAVAIISGISCADLVIYNFFLNFILLGQVEVVKLKLEINGNRRWNNRWSWLTWCCIWLTHGKQIEKLLLSM